MKHLEQNKISSMLPYSEDATSNNSITCRNNGKETNKTTEMKYILITGGTISGIGKGNLTSAVGINLQESNSDITVIKIDPYLNQDAGGMSPYEHGEVFVLSDGSEVDQDFGSYERNLNITLNGKNNITSGKILKSVLEKERKGIYNGETVQYTPHVKDEIKRWIKETALLPVTSEGKTPKICLLELGGTVTGFESQIFLIALNSFKEEVGKENFIHLHLDAVFNMYGTQKTKPIQTVINFLKTMELKPDLLFCRTEIPLEDEPLKKIHLQCGIPSEKIHEMPYLDKETDIPMYFSTKKSFEMIKAQLGLRSSLFLTKQLNEWISFYSSKPSKKVRIGIVGKYTAKSECYTSMINAINHSCLFNGAKCDLVFISSEKIASPSLLFSFDHENNKKVKCDKQDASGWTDLCNVDGIIIAGGHGVRGLDGKILACQYARENKIPVLGICLGLQVMVIEFARNVLGLKDANSTEFDKETKYPVVSILNEKTSEENGGTMYLGNKQTKILKSNSLMSKIYKKSFVEERHRHRYELTGSYLSEMQKNGFVVSGVDSITGRPNNMELEDHPFMFGTQGHPEFTSKIQKPSPPYVSFIEESLKNSSRKKAS